MELFAADGHDAGGCERVTGKSGMRPVNLYGHVHNNEPLWEGRYMNICVEHTEYRPLPLDAVRRLALARLDDPRPRAATTAEEIRCLDR